MMSPLSSFVAVCGACSPNRFRLFFFDNSFYVYFIILGFRCSIVNSIQGTGCYLILGKVVEDFCFPGIDVQKFAKLEIQGNPVMD